MLVLTRVSPRAGAQVLNPDNGHYYVFDPDIEGTMTDVLAASTGTIVVSGRYYFGHMVTITSQAELNFVHNTLGADADVWLALSDYSTEGDWRWLDGPEAGMPVSWTAWFEGEPNGETGENCVCSTVELKWFDIPCDGYRYLVIEYEPQSIVSGFDCVV